MKTLSIFMLLLVLSIFDISIASAQDVVTVKPQRDPNLLCGFNFTFTNHNTQSKNIDGVRFDLVTVTNGTVLNVLTSPSHWTTNPFPTDPTREQTSNADNTGIAPSTSLSGFVLDYYANDLPFDVPVTIHWVALNNGTGLDSGEVTLYCTQFQAYDKLDTVTVIPSRSGPDPCFTFTFINRNSQLGGAQQTSIKYVSFEILNGGTMRPSKITPPSGWGLDSVTSTRAYFHFLDPNTLPPGGVAAPFVVCLRANPTVTKFSFVWQAFDDGYAFIDRDTAFNIPNTAASSPNDADSVSVAKPSGCLFTLTLKNDHVANVPLAPSRIVRFALTSKTAGITFASAPNAPAKWTKVISPASDKVTYTAASLSDGIPSGTTADFSFGMNGPTTSGFSIDWESDQAASPFPPNFSLVTSGTLNLSCTISTPATDSASFSTTATTCGFKLTVKNTHNIQPESNLKQITISIPSGSGQLTPTGNSADPQWDFSNTSATSIKYTAPSGSAGMLPSPTASQDLIFTLTPKVPGQNITATWTTTDDQGTVTGTGTGTISCSPPIITCDTFRYAGIDDPQHNTDSCRENRFVFHNSKTSDISQIIVTVTDGWRIDSARVQESGWTQILSPSSVTFIPTAGMHPGETATFFFKFIAFFLPTEVKDTFHVISTTTDVLGGICTNDTLIKACRANISRVGVAPHSEYIGVANFAVHPNPARGATEITFDVTTQERVTIAILDELGHEAATISSKVMGAGSYTVPCLLNNLPDGVYYIRMETGLGVKTVKLVLTK